MASSSFIAKETLFAFISVGEQHKMFTLRTMLKGISRTMQGLPYTDFTTQYHQNLGTNLPDCIAKGAKYAQENGLEFRLSAAAESNDLVSINRLTPEQLDHRKWEQERDRLAKESAAQARAEQRQNELSNIVYTLDSKCDFGKYRETKTIAEMVDKDPDYLCWLYDNNELPFKQLECTFHAQLNWIYANVPRPIIKPVVSGWLAEKDDEKLTGITAICNNAGYREMSIGYGRMATVYEYELTEFGSGKQIIINYSGDKWEMEENKTYRFDGKIKQLAEWRSVKRTILNNVKNVQEI